MALQNVRQVTLVLFTNSVRNLPAWFSRQSWRKKAARNFNFRRSGFLLGVDYILSKRQELANSTIVGGQVQ
jgi:hypothetical protein